MKHKNPLYLYAEKKLNLTPRTPYQRILIQVKLTLLWRSSNSVLWILTTTTSDPVNYFKPYSLGDEIQTTKVFLSAFSLFWVHASMCQFFLLNLTNEVFINSFSRCLWLNIIGILKTKVHACSDKTL